MPDKCIFVPFSSLCLSVYSTFKLLLLNCYQILIIHISEKWKFLIAEEWWQNYLKIAFPVLTFLI